MSNVKFSVSWNVEKNLCNALSSLQQNGQFVDMTLAADGCYVKVHQLIIALASPYLKEMVTSIQCPHPVIFLNQVSYSTLCSLLEYIYSGEVLVSAEELDRLIEAGKALHIKGIQDMTIEHSTLKTAEESESIVGTEMFNNEEMQENELKIIQVTGDCDDLSLANEDEQLTNEDYKQIQITEGDMHEQDYNMENETLLQDNTEEHLTELDDTETYISEETERPLTHYDPSAVPEQVIQYTVSTQGSLQMILNRFIYFLKYTTQENIRQWRCVDYVTKKKCPAYVISKGNTILKRVAAHQHTYHDSKILKKIKAHVVFEHLSAAERRVKTKPGEKRKTFNVEIEPDTDIIQTISEPALDN